jgi:hypothetical protein
VATRAEGHPVTGDAFLDKLDAAIGCQECGKQLGLSPSSDFCGQECQAVWHAARVGTVPDYGPFGEFSYAIGRDYGYRLELAPLVMSAAHAQAIAESLLARIRSIDSIDVS